MNINKKWNDISVEVKSSLAYTFCSVIQKAISIVTLPFFARFLTTDEFGISGVYYSWYSIFSIIITLNLAYGSLNSALIKYEEEKDDYLSTIFIFFTINAFLFFLFYCFIYKYISAFLGIPFFLGVIMILEIVCSSIFQCIIAKYKFDYKYKEILLLTISFVILSQLLSVILVAFVDKNKGILKICGNSIVVVIFGIFTFLFILLKSRKKFDHSCLRYALCFNLPLILYYFSQVIFNESDRLMIKYFCSDSDVGLYTFAYTFGTSLSFVISSISSSYIPWFYRKLKQNKEEEDRQVSQKLSVIIAALIILLNICAPEIMFIMGGKKYLSAVYVIPPVSISLLLLFYAGLFDRLFFYYENKKFLTIGVLIPAIVNILLNYICIPVFGYIVASYTTFFSYIILVLVDYYFSNMIIKKKNISNKMYDIRMLCIILFVVVILSIIPQFFYGYFWPRYIYLFCLLLLVFFKRRKLIEVLQLIINDNCQ